MRTTTKNYDRVIPIVLKTLFKDFNQKSILIIPAVVVIRFILYGSVALYLCSHFKDKL